MNAKDLLLRLLEYHYLWSRSDRIESKPSQVRKGQIESLLEAFELSKKHVNPLVQIKYRIVGQKEELNRSKTLNRLTNIEYVRGGEFLHDRPNDLNREISEIAKQKIGELFPNVGSDLLDKEVSIRWMFNSLLRFRQQTYELAYPNQAMMEGFSVGLYYSHYLQGQLKALINENIDDIDNTLWLILDPKKREFELGELKSKYGYKEIDLKKLDLEWSMENY